VRRIAVVVVVIGALALGLAGFLASPGTKTVTVTVVTPPASKKQGAPVVVTIVPTREDRRALSGSCGVERGAVKHLTDGFVLPSDATVLTPEKLVSMPAPPVTQDSPRFPVEQQLVAIQDVHVIAAKQEGDSDLHVIIVTPTGAELNVEAPQAQCDSSSPYAALLAQARQAMDVAMPTVSSSHYTPLDLTATIAGVLFFDVLHGQRGAPNGVELHPVTYFSTAGGPAPPLTTASTTTTEPATTAG
jgi:mRNA-degrading endonuclease toxin of MazEF toxin-antitoxin module